MSFSSWTLCARTQVMLYFILMFVFKVNHVCDMTQIDPSKIRHICARMMSLLPYLVHFIFSFHRSYHWHLPGYWLTLLRIFKSGMFLSFGHLVSKFITSSCMYMLQNEMENASMFHVIVKESGNGIPAYAYFLLCCSWD